tara:strand:- start:9 stop:437 length:429 start_codon:yes stop_codon:yes gene_type:complete
MKILILHGPNLNLVGKISAKAGDNITLGKINSALKQSAKKLDSDIKILQTHKVFNAINFIQRNRNWADGLLFSPMSWSLYEYSILECLKISNLLTIQILFDGKYQIVDNETGSIFSSYCKKTLSGNPKNIYLDGIKELNKII